MNGHKHILSDNMRLLACKQTFILDYHSMHYSLVISYAELF